MSTPPLPLKPLATRHARTVGRAALNPAPSALWVPHLAGALIHRLGELRPVWNQYMVPPLVEVAASGQEMYSSHKSESIFAWDLTSGEKRHLDLRGDCWAMRLSPDGRHLAAATGKPGVVQIYDTVEDRLIRVLSGHIGIIGSIAYSPDGRSIATAASDNSVRAWDVRTGDLRYVFSNDSRVNGVNYSPDGVHLACACHDGSIKVIDAHHGTQRMRFHGHANAVRSVSYAPNGETLASASDDTTVRIWDPLSGRAICTLGDHVRAVMSVIHSPDSARIATMSLDQTFRIWDIRQQKCLGNYRAIESTRHSWSYEKLVYRESHTRYASWAPSGAFLAFADFDGKIILLDTRESMPAQPSPSPSVTSHAPSPPSRELRRLPGLVAALQRYHGHAAPLGLLRDVLRGLQGRASDGPVAVLASQTNFAALQALHWPPDALAAVVLLLCADAHDPAFAPPAGVTPSELESAITTALASGHACPEQPSNSVWPAVHAALDRLDPRSLIPLLHALGPAACAAQPHLLLALRDLLPTLVPLSAPACRMLATTTPLDRREGVAHGPLGIVPAGTRPTGPPWTLRPWQWALPADAFACRRAQNRLSHTDRHGAEPPRLPPTVLLLDDSLESLPVEQLLRAAALHLATSLVRAGVPAYLLTTAGHAAPLQHPSHLAELLAPIRRHPVDIPRLLARAHDLARSLPHAADPPTIVLLTHVYFAADAPPSALSPDLRAMFVRYPNHHHRPAWLARCRRHTILGPTDLQRIPDALADLLR